MFNLKFSIEGKESGIRFARGKGRVGCMSATALTLLAKVIEACLALPGVIPISLQCRS